MVNRHLFYRFTFSKAIMGNLSSLPNNDHKPDQPPEKGMREYGLDFNKKYHIGGPFFIEAQPKTDNGIYKFYLYHIDASNGMTQFFKFETFHELRKKFNVVYNGPIVKFIFETESFEKGLKHVIEYSFDFSKSFHSEKDSNQPLKSIPHLFPSDGKIINLEGKYWYYIIFLKEPLYDFFIVESPDKTSRGFESVFKEGDVVIKKINVESKNFPFVMNDKEGNLIIASADEGFVPIPICLPLAQPSSQESSQ